MRNGLIRLCAVFANSIFKTVTDEAEKEAVAGILESGEFYVFRTLYFGGEKYTSGTDIKVGDEVIV